MMSPKGDIRGLPNGHLLATSAVKGLSGKENLVSILGYLSLKKIISTFNGK